MAEWPATEPLVALWSAPFQVEGGIPHPPGVMRLLRPTRTLTDMLPATDLSAGQVAGAPVPVRSGWVGVVSYDYGRALEPRAVHSTHSRTDRAWPHMQWLRFESDQQHPIDVDDDTPARQGAYAIGPLASVTGRERYTRDAARVIEYLRAGDAYQVNLAHRLSGPFSGSARALAIDLFERARPHYGVYIELPDDPLHGRRAIISLSPELFLRFNPRTRTISTRPMKGTRRARTALGAEAGVLRDSLKDQAELNMIVDLMRNDLTRVCEVPSVRVTRARDIEAHEGGGLLQATATVLGTLRAGVSLHDVLRATFPGGSVTGAPKIRAMQIIDELEPVARGPYCGSIGVLHDDGAFEFNIAIRTALITGTPAIGGRDRFAHAALDYSVGAGITVRSEPDAEWRETLDKAALIQSLSNREAR